MAKKDNKTEHVMKLITKDGSAASSVSDDVADDFPQAEVEVITPSGDTPSYRTKLKIEIEPEIEIKEPDRAAGQSVSVSVREAAPDAPAPDTSIQDASAPDAPEYEIYSEDVIPDGTPYDMPEEHVAEAQNRGPTVIEEVRALRESNMNILKHDEQRRAKKIQFESSLLDRNRNLINLSELLTKELLPSVMEHMDVCVCPICTANVLALALNTLPTKYVTTDEGKQYTQLEVYKRQNELDVIAALTRACVRVKSSPRHEIIDDLDE
jgi:competence protein ComFB